MKFSKTAGFAVCILLLTAAASATSIINSGDWREVLVAKNMADLNGEETFTVVTPSDAKVAGSTIENPETLYTADSPAFRNISRKTGLEFERVEKVSWRNFSRQAEGFVVVGKEFGTDAVSVLPYANRKNYSIVFYRQGVKGFLRDTSKPKIFYGIDPRGFPESERITEGWQDRNLEIARRIGGKWAVISPRGYFDPAELDEKPVLFRMGRRKLADFIDNSSIDNLKVIGPENMLYAKEIDVLAQKDLGIVAKTGRAFTGISDLQGVYGIKKVRTPYRRYSMDLVDVSRFNGSITMEFVNQGNTRREVDGVVAGKNFSLVLPPFSSVRKTVDVKKNVSQFELSYSTGRSSESLSYTNSSISWKQVRPLTDLEIRSSSYNGSALELEVENTGKRDVWVMVQAGDSYRRKKISQGSTRIYVLEASGLESYTVFQGMFENQYTFSREYSVEYERPADNLFVLGVSVLLVVLIGSAAYVVREFTR